MPTGSCVLRGSYRFCGDILHAVFTCDLVCGQDKNDHTKQPVNTVMRMKTPPDDNNDNNNNDNSNRSVVSFVNNNNNNDDETASNDTEDTWMGKYGSWVLDLHRSMNENFFIPLFLHVADHPCWYLVGILVVSASLTVAAVMTGSFEIRTQIVETAVPLSSYTLLQREWIIDSFDTPRPNSALLHAEGNNVLNHHAVTLAWEIDNRIPTMTNFQQLCQSGLNVTTTTTTRQQEGLTRDGSALLNSDCKYQSVTFFWTHRQQYETELAVLSTNEEKNAYIVQKMSAATFADGTPVVRGSLFGRFVTSQDGSNRLESAKSIAVTFGVVAPPQDTTRRDFELSFGSTLQDLADTEGTAAPGVYLESFSQAILSDELEEPILGDLPLVGAAVLIMCLFTAFSMMRWKRNTKGQRFVSSNFLLGIGAAVTIVLSTATGYSICALCGYPITFITQTLPFILIGIGLDDAFILVGAYYETDTALSFRDRLMAMTRLAAPSITATTLTDCVASALGASSTVPAIRWFCFYAVVCIAVDYIYQITFFMALLVLDHDRSKSGRYDCLICFKAPHAEGGRRDMRGSVREAPRSDLCIRSYADLLLRPAIKWIVLISAVALVILAGVAASYIEVDYDITELTPRNSPTDRFEFARRDYFATESGQFQVTLYYNDLDVSDASVRDQMRLFHQEIEALGDTASVEAQPYWLRDFETYSQSSTNNTMPFKEQLQLFLSSAEFGPLYKDDFVFDDQGNVLYLREPLKLAKELLTATQHIRWTCYRPSAA